MKYGGNEIIVRLSKAENSFKITVEDNGFGIEKQHRNKIFDKFYRISTAKRNEVGGFGLGLFYVKRICSLHHWKIAITNNENTGIKVSITLPKK